MAFYADASSAGYRTTWSNRSQLDEAASNLLRSLQAISDDDDSDDGGNPRSARSLANGRRAGDSSADYANIPRRSPPQAVPSPPVGFRSTAAAATPQGNAAGHDGSSHAASPLRPRHLASSSSVPAMPRRSTLGQSNDRFRTTGYSVLGDGGAAMQVPIKAPSRDSREFQSHQQFSALRENMGGGGVQLARSWAAENVGSRGQLADDDTLRTRTNGKLRSEDELNRVKEELHGLKSIHAKTVDELSRAQSNIQQLRADLQSHGQRAGEEQTLCDELVRARRECDRLREDLLEATQNSLECDRLKQELHQARQANSDLRNLQSERDELEAGLRQERQKVVHINKDREKLSMTCQTLSANLETQEQELAYAQQQTESLSAELEDWRRRYEQCLDPEHLLQENRRLQADSEELARVKRKSQDLTAELEQLQRRDGTGPSYEMLLAENKQLKDELQESESERQRLEIEVKATASSRPKGPAAHLEQENKRLQAEVHDRVWTLKRMESEQEKILSGYSQFINCLSTSSATPVLDTLFELNGAHLLGMGHYGYVMTCNHKASGDTVVLKVQSTRWLDVAVSEWNHGSAIAHPNIVEFKQVLMHSDADHTMEQRLRAAFDDGTLTGKKPKKFPGVYICTVLEYMGCGTVWSLMEKHLISLEGVAAVTRQVASALAFMHQSKRTHNDIKPENILLRQSPDGSHLVVKLADLGLAAHSVDRTKDKELFAYTIWCMVCGKEFHHCPPKEERDAAISALLRSPFFGCRATALSQALIEVVTELWKGSLEMSGVEKRKEFLECEVQIPTEVEDMTHLRQSSQLQVMKRALAACSRFVALAEKARRGSGKSLMGPDSP